MDNKFLVQHNYFDWHRKLTSHIWVKILHPTSQTSQITNIPHPERPTSPTSHILNIPHPKHPTFQTSHILIFLHPNIPHPKHSTITGFHIPNISHPERHTPRTSYIPNTPHLEHPTSLIFNIRNRKIIVSLLFSFDYSCVTQISWSISSNFRI